MFPRRLNKISQPTLEVIELTEDNIGIVELVIVANPSSHKSPEAFHFGILSELGCFLFLSSCECEERELLPS
jgi:hypothetical protein